MEHSLELNEMTQRPTERKRDYAKEYSRLYGTKAEQTEDQKKRREVKSFRSKEKRRLEKKDEAGKA